MPTPKVFTVSQLNAHISNLFASDEELKMIFIEGELSNVNINSKSGHLYFSLKDTTEIDEKALDYGLQALLETSMR